MDSEESSSSEKNTTLNRWHKTPKDAPSRTNHYQIETNPDQSAPDVPNSIGEQKKERMEMPSCDKRNKSISGTKREVVASRAASVSTPTPTNSLVTV
jgi:hypothetical protein